MELSIDFETRSLVDIKLGAWRYAEDPSTEILCMAWQLPSMAAPSLWYPSEFPPLPFLEWLQAHRPIRAWNAEFEVAVYTLILRPMCPELPPLRPSQVHCTQAEALAMSLPASLGDCGEALGVAEDHLKDKEGKKLIQYLCRPYRGKLREDPERLERLGEYCVQDVVAELAIAKRLRRLDKTELALFRRNLMMNKNGLPVDMYRVHEMRRRWHELKDQANEECLAISGFKATQVKQLTEFCGLDNLQKKTVERALQDDDLDCDVANVLRARQVAGSTSLAKLDKLPKAVCKDGTMKGLFKYHGASTGRWVSQGGFNAQNLPRGLFEEQEEYEHALDNVACTSAEELVSCLRAVFAFPMTVVDYSQIETRMLLWLADDLRNLNEIRRGLDPYKTMAARQYGVHYDDVTKAQRQIGKAAVLGCGYQLGGPGFVSYCDNMDIELSEIEAQGVVAMFRDKHAKVKQTWYDCNAAACYAIDNPGKMHIAAKSRFLSKGGYLWVVLPSGRRICYKAPRVIEEEWPDGRPKYEIRYMGRDRYTRKWTECKTYGGSLFQSITQGSARDVMADAMLRMWARGMDVRGTVHDEVICYGHCQEAMEEIMLQVPGWCEGLPVAVDGWTGSFYRK